jgi:hypothetical protein
MRRREEEGRGTTPTTPSVGTETVTTAITGQGSFVTCQDFDPATGRLHKITYPERTGLATGVRVRYDFNACARSGKCVAQRACKPALIGFASRWFGSETLNSKNRRPEK